MVDRTSIMSREIQLVPSVQLIKGGHLCNYSAVAIKLGIRFTIDTGLVLAVVESDALSVVQMVNSGVSISMDIGRVVDDIVASLQLKLPFTLNMDRQPEVIHLLASLGLPF
ncbi:hypothetical protein QYF36_007573 [Acer negundo]|nr:hypothetical protein QYF36_007573 [Acer negundo]